MPFEGEYKEDQGYRYYKPEEYKGYLIHPVENIATGERVFMCSKKGVPGWVAADTKLENLGAKIDMFVLSAKYKNHRGKK